MSFWGDDPRDDRPAILKDAEASTRKREARSRRMAGRAARRGGLRLGDRDALEAPGPRDPLSEGEQMIERLGGGPGRVEVLPMPEVAFPDVEFED